MTLPQQARVLYRKAVDDSRVLDVDLSGAILTDEIWGFHAQQAVEKLLKATIAWREQAFPFTHNLFQLADLAAEYVPDLPSECETLVELTPFAAELRYSYTQPSASSAKLDRKQYRDLVQALLTYTGRLLHVAEQE